MLDNQIIKITVLYMFDFQSVTNIPHKIVNILLLGI